jgi:Protein of unknown function (DUF2281)
MDNMVLYSKLAILPTHLRSEVSDFIDSLLSKTKINSKTPNTSKPIFGSAKGMFKLKHDFDEPLEDFKDYMN